MQEKAAGVVRPGAIKSVAGHLVAEAAEVNANLMSAARADLHLDQGVPEVALQHLPVSDGFPAGFRVGPSRRGHPYGLPGVA